MLSAWWPDHKAGCLLEHNPHKANYETVAAFIRWRTLDAEDFGGQEWLDKAAEGDELWTLQWYPNTPIGFNTLAAPTLERLIALATAAKNPEPGGG